MRLSASIVSSVCGLVCTYSKGVCVYMLSSFFFSNDLPLSRNLTICPPADLCECNKGSPTQPRYFGPFQDLRLSRCHSGLLRRPFAPRRSTHSRGKSPAKYESGNYKHEGEFKPDQPLRTKHTQAPASAHT